MLGKEQNCPKNVASPLKLKTGRDTESGCDRGEERGDSETVQMTGKKKAESARQSCEKEKMEAERTERTGKTNMEEKGAGEVSERMKARETNVRYSDTDKNREAVKVVQIKKDQSCLLSDSCSVTTGHLCTSFIQPLFDFSVISPPPRHPATFFFFSIAATKLTRSSSNLDLKGRDHSSCLCGHTMLVNSVLHCS